MRVTVFIWSVKDFFFCCKYHIFIIESDLNDRSTEKKGKTEKDIAQKQRWKVQDKKLSFRDVEQTEGDWHSLNQRGQIVGFVGFACKISILISR